MSVSVVSESTKLTSIKFGINDLYKKSTELIHPCPFFTYSNLHFKQSTNKVHRIYEKPFILKILTYDAIYRLNVATESLALLLHVKDVPASNHGLKPNFVIEVFSWFASVLSGRYLDRNLC
jgi:hypothetical protein